MLVVGPHIVQRFSTLWVAASNLVVHNPIEDEHLLGAKATFLADVEDVGLAADLAVFHIALSRTGGQIYRSFIPLSATGALESGCHFCFRRWTGLCSFRRPVFAGKSYKDDGLRGPGKTQAKLRVAEAPCACVHRRESVVLELAFPLLR